METVRLEWRGPLAIGNLPETREAVHDLKVPAIYIFFRCYRELKGKTLVYVGKTENLSRRLAMHYSDFLGCVANQFREDGTLFRLGWPCHYFRSIQENLEETLRFAVGEAKRTTFVYAPIQEKERREAVEATIIWRLADKRLEETFTLWNTQCGSRLVREFRFEHAQSGLAFDRLTPEEQDRLSKILAVCASDSVSASVI